MISLGSSWPFSFRSAPSRLLAPPFGHAIAGASITANSVEPVQT